MQHRGIAHYYLKPSAMESGVRFLESELAALARACGCHDMELWQNEREPSHWMGIGIWDNEQDVEKFKKEWAKKEPELMKYCTKLPHREMYKIRWNSGRPSKKVA